jgi:hypothetical protein
MNSGLFDKLLNSAALKGLPLFTEAVHEEITQRIYGVKAIRHFVRTPTSVWQVHMLSPASDGMTIHHSACYLIKPKFVKPMKQYVSSPT